MKVQLGVQVLRAKSDRHRSTGCMALTHLRATNHCIDLYRIFGVHFPTLSLCEMVVLVDKSLCTDVLNAGRVLPGRVLPAFPACTLRVAGPSGSLR